eukprot:1157418-Pelagomonas_calceolata.AAC.9
MPFPLSPDDTLLLLLPLLLVLGLLLLLLVATEVGDSEEELPGEGLPSLLLPEVEGVDRTASYVQREYLTGWNFAGMGMMPGEPQLHAG